MKRIVLPSATLAVLLLTATVLYPCGWITPRPQASHPGYAPRNQAHDQHAAEAAVRYRQNGPTHWRCYMLQR